ncbi:AAA family ATPase [Helicobacter cetorum]|uniref:AAA family ATPase n=1 Tax=Helicobacter cetorum TaxID=138563 RepID=UPI000CF07EB3|nr:AAA family ATPase [Helicobacter cetorum]
MELKTRFLQLCNFEPLGENSPTKLLLNAHFQHSMFDRYGGLVILVGENNVGKSRVLEALKTFNDVDIKICNEKDYFKPYTLEDTILSLEEETSVDNKITDFSCVDLKIQFKENDWEENDWESKELLKELISYPFEKHIKALGVQRQSTNNLTHTNDSDYLKICAFVRNFIDLIAFYGQLKPFIDFYKEKLNLSEFVTKHAGETKHARETNNLLFKELVKNLSGSENFIEKFCLCVDGIIKCNASNKKYDVSKFYLLQEPKQNKLQEISMKLQKIFDNSKKRPNEIIKELKNIIKTLNIEVFGNNFDKLFESKVLELKDDYQKEKCEKLIDEVKQAIENQYPINETFMEQFKEFKSNLISRKKNIKESLIKLDETRETFEQQKGLLIQEIENYLKNHDGSENVLEFNTNILLDNIYQVCKKYIASHTTNNGNIYRDIKYMMCQTYLNKIDLLLNSEIRMYSKMFEPAKKSLWETIKALDKASNTNLFPKSFNEIKDRFKTSKEEIKQSKSVLEVIEYCRECNPYTAFEDLRYKNFGYCMAEIHEGFSIATEHTKDFMDKDFKTRLTILSKGNNAYKGILPQPFDDSRFFRHLFHRINFDFYKIGSYLKKGCPVGFDGNNGTCRLVLDKHKKYRKMPLDISEDLLGDETIKKFANLPSISVKIESTWDNDILKIKLYDNKSELYSIKTSFAKFLEHHLQLRIDSSVARDFNRLCAIQNESSNNYKLRIHVQYCESPRENNKEPRKVYKIKFEICDYRKSDEQKPIILEQQSTGFKWAFNILFGTIYGFYKPSPNTLFHSNSIVVMDEPATHLSVPARKQFREFLKKYAHENGITFVLATHDPFLVDTDHLDEIRIVEKQKNDSVIHNDFNYPLNDASKDSDALDKIKRSLGVGQHIFHDPRKHQIIFVEGITDYCYLTAFKLYFNKRYPQYKDNPINFTFLPISGLKDNPKAMKETIKALQTLDRNPIVLIDDDRKSGVDPQKANSEKFKEKNKDLGSPITILQLFACCRCDKYFKQIEDLFSVCDKEKYAKNKRMELAMAFKTKLLYNDSGQDVVSKQAESNFLKLFEWIIWATNLIKN